MSPRIPGYCTGCRRPRTVNVSGPALALAAAGGSIPQGLCHECEEPERFPQVGQRCRDAVAGGLVMQIVGLDRDFVHVKRADESKRALATQRGSYPIGRREFAREWKIVP